MFSYGHELFGIYGWTIIFDVYHRKISINFKATFKLVWMKSENKIYIYTLHYILLPAMIMD